MSRAKDQIAVKSQELDRRRQSMRYRRHALRQTALRYCGRPSTLGVAALSGFLLGKLLLPLGRSHQPRQPRQPSRLLDPFVQMIPVLVMEGIRHSLIRRTQPRNHRLNTEEKPTTSASP